MKKDKMPEIGSDEYKEYIYQFIKISQKIINAENHKNIISINATDVDKLAEDLGISYRQAVEEIRVHFNAGVKTEEPVKTYTIEDMEKSYNMGYRTGQYKATSQDIESECLDFKTFIESYH